MPRTTIPYKRLRRFLLDWYDQQARELPWRSAPAGKRNPWQVLLSEYMLQQTTVSTIISRFPDMIRTFPTPEALAKASLDDLNSLWQGLGYYRRAQNLHKTARKIVDDFEGEVPSQPDELISLPGIGPYSSRAIAALAFDHPSIGVDGNVSRVIGRLEGLCAMPDAKTMQGLADQFLGADRHGACAEALIELGATICRPSSPQCLICPLSDACEARKQQRAEDFPPKKNRTRKTKPHRSATCWVIRNDARQIFLIKRPETGLLAGLYGFPMSLPAVCTHPEPLPSSAIPDLKMQDQPMVWHKNSQWVEHEFTHFRLYLHVYEAMIIDGSAAVFNGGVWDSQDNPTRPLPTLFRKVLEQMADNA